MKDEIFGLVAFRSRQQAINFDMILKKNGVDSSLVSTPKDVALGCGISVKVSPKDLFLANNLFRNSAESALIGFYYVERKDGRTFLKGVNKEFKKD